MCGTERNGSRQAPSSVLKVLKDQKEILVCKVCKVNEVQPERQVRKGIRVQPESQDPPALKVLKVLKV